MAVVVDRGHAFVARAELHPARDVAHVAVGVLGAHDELLLGARRRARPRRDRLRGRVTCASLSAGGGVPAAIQSADHAIFQRIRRRSACRRRAASRSVGFSRIRLAAGSASDTRRPTGLARERIVIDVGIVAAQRQLEAVLAGQRPVARALSCSPSWSAPGSRRLRKLQVNGACAFFTRTVDGGRARRRPSR